MLFNSWTYLLFLPVVLGTYWLMPARWRVLFLVVASYVFYGWWDYRFLVLIWVSTIVDFLVGRRLAETEVTSRRRRLLVVSLMTNLGILGFFKYWGFFVESAGGVLAALGMEANPGTLEVILPVGISFYTFQTMSYTIDIYRRQLEPERSLVRFGLFVCFFPQLVAGPIERARRLLPQIRGLGESSTSPDWLGAGQLILRGLFRKIVIADGVAPVVNEVFANPSTYGGVTLLVGVFAFSLQIYGDFAGYTDIARGSAKLFGVDLMENFKAPYAATGFSDFWRRWHISLSTWLRDYLYIPLGGNQGSKLAILRNLMVTMLLGGLWHGAGWGFVIWGALHGFYLVIERVIGWRTGRRPQLPVLLVFAAVSLTWVPFRATSLPLAMDILTGLFDPLGGAQLTFAPITVAVMGLATMFVDVGTRRDLVDPFTSKPAFVRGLSYGTAILLAALFWPAGAAPFIYFQF
jgi:alginate O-acetyltransferase complex protein AlgI